MHRLVIRLALVAITVGGFVGCGESKEKKLAMLPPYEPPITMADIAPGLAAPDNSYQLLVDERSVGRFACPLAVAKLMPCDGDHDAELRFVEMKPAEQAYWTTRMRGVSAVSDVLFLRPKAVKPFEPDLVSMCNSAIRMDAPLLLIYASNGLGPNSAQVMGVLYDTNTCKPLGTLHAASRFYNDKQLEVSPYLEEGDLRDVDARYQAQRDFERHALALLRELIERDVPPATTQPHRWHRPLIERGWMRGR